MLLYSLSLSLFEKVNRLASVHVHVFVCSDAFIMTIFTVCHDVYHETLIFYEYHHDNNNNESLIFIDSCLLMATMSCICANFLNP